VYNAYQSLLNGLDTLVQVCESFPTPPSNVPFIHYGISPQKSVCFIVVKFYGFGLSSHHSSKKMLLNHWFKFGGNLCIGYGLFLVLPDFGLWAFKILHCQLSEKQILFI